jgi:hypothetical protein
MSAPKISVAARAEAAVDAVEKAGLALREARVKAQQELVTTEAVRLEAERWSESFTETEAAHIAMRAARAKTEENETIAAAAETARLQVELAAARARAVNTARLHAEELARVTAATAAAETARLKAELVAAVAAAELEAARQHTEEMARVSAEEKAARMNCDAAVAVETARLNAELADAAQIVETAMLLAETTAAETARLKAELVAAAAELKAAMQHTDELALVSAEEKAARVNSDAAMAVETARLKAELAEAAQTVETATLLAEMTVTVAAELAAEKALVDMAVAAVETAAVESRQLRVTDETLEKSCVGAELPRPYLKETVHVWEAATEEEGKSEDRAWRAGPQSDIEWQRRLSLGSPSMEAALSAPGTPTSSPGQLSLSPSPGSAIDKRYRHERMVCNTARLHVASVALQCFSPYMHPSTCTCNVLDDFLR